MFLESIPCFRLRKIQFYHFIIVKMKRIDRRLVYIAVTVFAFYVLFGAATREIKTEERISEASSKWIYFKGMKLKVSL